MEYAFADYDFENPSFLFRIEDALKGALGFFLYNPFLSKFALKGDENILDFGCGGGAGAKFLLKRLNEKGRVTCLDTSQFWMERAMKRLSKNGNVSFICGDIRDSGISDGTFDIISIVHVLHDVRPEEREETVVVLARKLKAGGKLFLIEPTKPSHGMPVSEIEMLMKRAGLTELEKTVKKNSFFGAYARKKNC